MSLETTILYRPMEPKELELVAASGYREVWIPAEELAEMNRNIVGLIEVIAEYKSKAEQ